MSDRTKEPKDRSQTYRMRLEHLDGLATCQGRVWTWRSDEIDQAIGRRRETAWQGWPFRVEWTIERLTANPAKVNALRALEEAAKRHGWVVTTKSGEHSIVAGDSARSSGEEAYIDSYGGNVYVCTTAGMDTPAELVTLLLEAARL